MRSLSVSLTIFTFVLVTLALSGCDDIIPTPKPSVTQFKAPAFNDDQDILAFSLADATGASPSPNPAPSPDGPKVGDTCPVCNGRGKSGDGLQPCMPCGGDGRVDANDPILSSQETLAEDEGIQITAPQNEVTVEVDGVEYLPKKDFEEWQTGDFSEKTSSITQAIEDRASALAAKVNEEIGKLGSRLNELAATVQSVQESVKSLDSKVQSLTPPPKKEEPKVEVEGQRSEVGAKDQYDYRISYLGVYWIWDGVNGFKSTVPGDRRHITFPDLGPIDQQKEVKICVAKPQGEQGTVCTICPVQRIPKLQSAPAIKSVPQQLPVSSSAAKSQVLGSGRLVPGSADWQKLPDYGQTNDPVLIQQRVPIPPLSSASSLPADQEPTPMSDVDLGLRWLRPKPDEVPADFGCGRDARWLIEAVKVWKSKKAIGIEIDPEVAESARGYVAAAGLSDQIEIITGDATTTNIEADVGVVYQFPDVLEKLKPQLMKIKRAFVSYAHAVPGGVPGFSMQQRGDFFIYTKLTPVAIQQPKPVKQQITHQPVYQPPVMNYRPMAVYGGRTYSGPVCNRPGCSMCNNIRRQLWR